MVDVVMPSTVTHTLMELSPDCAVLPSSSAMSTAERLALRKASAAQNRAERHTANRSSRSKASEMRVPESPATPSSSRLKLSYSEQRVLKSGIKKIHNTVALREDAPPLLQFATRPNGSSYLLPESKSYFERLLSNQVQLQSSTQSDVCNSQRDLRHLSLEQLLVLRVGTLDFATMSQSHVAHTNWNEMLDGYLFKHIARYVLKSACRNRGSNEDVLYNLGRQITLIVGAAEMLQADQQDGATPVPIQWALQLDRNDWGDNSLALFHILELRVSLFAGDSNDEVVGVASDGAVAVVWDRSSGFGKDRALSWEIACLDPATDDIVHEIARANRGKTMSRGSMGDELKSALQHRKPSAPSPTEKLEKSNTKAEYFSMCSVDEENLRSEPPLESIQKSMDVPRVDEELQCGCVSTSGADSPRMPSLPSISFAFTTSYPSPISAAGMYTISPQAPQTEQVQSGPMPSLPRHLPERTSTVRFTFEYDTAASIEQPNRQFRVRKSMVEPLPPPELEHFGEELPQRRWTTIIN